MEHISQFVKSSHPKLIDIKLAWNDAEPARLIVQNFITELVGMLNFRDEATMNISQVRECSLLMLREAYDLNIAELYEFFNRIKTAMYGEFYGSIDSNKIMADFRLYRKDLESCRRAVKMSAEAAQRRKEHEARLKIPYTPPHKPIEEFLLPENECEHLMPKPIISTSLKNRGIL